MTWNLGFDDCCGCVIFEDDFDRADDTDIGTDWTEGSGDWEIVSNRLQAKGGFDDQVCTADATNGTYPVYVSVTAIARAWGDQLRLFTNGGTVYVELGPLETAGTGYVKLVTTTGEVSAQVDLTLDTEYPMTLCIVDSGSSFYAVATVAGETLYRFTAYTSSSSGVATGVLDDVADFDDFTINRTAAQNNECQDCSEVTCGCLPGTPPQIQVDFETDGPTDPLVDPADCDCAHVGSVLLDLDGDCEWHWYADPEDIEEFTGLCHVISVHVYLGRDPGGVGTYTITGVVTVGYNEFGVLLRYGDVTFTRTFSNADGIIDCESLLVGDLDDDDPLICGATPDTYCCGPVSFTIAMPP